MDPTIPYNDLPLLPPDAEVESARVLKAVISARARLAEARLAGSELPDESVLVNSIPLLEARDSSRIENIVTTSDELFVHADAATATDPAAKEALRYRTALLAGVQSIRSRPLVTNTAIEICSALKDRPMQIRNVPGTALADDAGNIVYTPPVGEDVIRDKLANWERYLHNHDIDVLVRMAVTHYQFEAIHPFTDGNGRTGRIINTLMLVGEGLLDVPTLYLSRYILANRAEYYRLLRAVTRDDDWESWILFILSGVEAVSDWTVQRIAAITELIERTDLLIRAQAPALYSREFMDLIFAQPYCRIRNLVDTGIAKRQTASVYLRRLADLGIMEQTIHGRDKVFVNRQLVTVLES